MENNSNSNNNSIGNSTNNNNNNNNNKKRHFKKPMSEKPSSSTNNNNKPRHALSKEMPKRDLELIQLETRYKSSYRLVKETEQETTVRLAIKPSDPDFPYEMVALQVQLHVPKDYPSSSCSLDVLNTDIPKGFAINLEKGYLERVQTSAVHQTLVRQMNWLDRNMESLLQQAPAPTVRFVSNQQRLLPQEENTAAKAGAEIPVTLTSQRQPQQTVSTPKKEYIKKQPIKKEIVTASTSTSLPQQQQQQVEEPQQQSFQLEKQHQHSFTPEQVEAAAKRRRHEFRQLQTRFCDTFKTLRTNHQETVASFIMNINDPEFTHGQMLGGRELYIKYHIPTLYPLEPCSIDIDNKGLDKTRASWITQAFDQQVKNGNYNLFENLNWLNRHLEQILESPPTHKSEEQREVDEIAAAQQRDLKPPVVQRPLDPTSTLSPNAPLFTPKKLKKTSLFEDDETRKNKVIIVNDPTLIHEEEEEEQQADEEVEVEVADDQDGVLMYSQQSGDEGTIPAPKQITIRRGTEVRLVDPVLENVSLFRCTNLHVIVKCNRCKETVDIENIQPETQDSQSKERWMACPTCSSVIGIKFLADLVHQGGKSIGLLQLAGCTAFDLLPSHYTGTCGECMTDMSNPLRLSPHDSPQSHNCFSCHAKMTIGLNDYRFVLLGQGGERLKADEEQVMKLKKKKKRGLGLTIGEPLPDQGTCAHYRKSKRWFRFVCCNKLYACDVCHDSHEDHPYEMARRHVCGLCSRESQIQPGKPCACGYEFEHTTGKGAFWEGGKGVRDKVKMSRKDPHKHKGVGKTTSKKQDRVGVAGKERNKQTE